MKVNLSAAYSTEAYSRAWLQNMSSSEDLSIFCFCSLVRSVVSSCLVAKEYQMVLGKPGSRSLATLIPAPSMARRLYTQKPWLLPSVHSSTSWNEVWRMQGLPSIRM